jgi:peptide/nickel transport system permease protein
MKPAPRMDAAHEPTESKDYWDLVLEQLGRRKLFKVALSILTLLYGVAAFAPLLANDKPFVIEAVDLSGFEEAVRRVRPSVTGMENAARQTDEAYAASVEGKDSAAPTRSVAFAQDLSAARGSLAAMRRFLPAAQQGPVAAVERQIEDAARLFGIDDEYFAGLKRAGQFDASITTRSTALPSWRGPSDEAGALAALEAVKPLAKELPKALAPWDPARPEEKGVHLLGSRSYPLARSLHTYEVVLMALWLLWATWPLWNRAVNRLVLRGDRARVRRARRYKVAGALLIALCVGLVWRANVGVGRHGLDFSPYKERLARKTMFLVAEGRTLREATEDPTLEGRVVWAPVPYGYAETQAVEKLRPPTWDDEGEIDAATGLLVHPDWAPDPVSLGGPGPGQPLEVRPGEPMANAWNRRLAGTDDLGRDFFGRMIWGARVSLSVGIVSATLLTLIGVVLGSLAGYFGGLVDLAVMRSIEVLQSIPSFFLILMAMAFTDPQVVPPIFAIVVVIGLVSWTGVARLVRGEFLRLRDQEFVIAARALGFSSARTIFRHVLPNALSPVLVAAAFAVAAGILIESAISFLGFGVQPPEPSWGSLVNASRSAQHWWIQVFPGVLIFVTVTCYNLVGDAVRDALDPKLRV